MPYPDLGHWVCIRTMTIKMVPSSIEDIENMIEEVHSADTAPKMSNFNVG